jgi:cell shape-determining protein MreD
MKENSLVIRTYIYIILSTFVVSIVQTSLFLELFNVSANPYLVLVLSFGLYLSLGLEYGLFTALIGGVLLDFVTFNVIGMTSLLFVVFIYFSRTVRTYVLQGFRAQIILLITFSLLIRYFTAYETLLRLLAGLALDMLFFGIFYWLGVKARDRRIKSGFRVPYKNL